MPSVAAVTTPQPATPTRRRLIASGHIRPRYTTSTPRPTGMPCVWCGHAILLTSDPTERIGLAELHRCPCVEQFEIYAYGMEDNQ